MDIGLIYTSFIDTFKFRVNKLFQAWKEHKEIIICVDFDDTIKANNDISKQIVNDVILTIQDAQKLGAVVILYTCRGTSDYNKIKNYCKQINFNFDILNPTIPFKEGYSQKPYCNIMLDDKAGLEQSVLILREAIKYYKIYKNETNN